MDDLWWYRRLAGVLAAGARRRPPTDRVRSVAFVSPARFADDSIVGGGERAAWELAAAMARLVPTRMISFGPRRLSTRRGPLAVEIHPPRRWIGDVTYDPLSFEFVRDLAGVDVVHCNHYFLAAPQLAIVAGAALGKRVFVTDRGAMGHHVDREVDVAGCVTEFLPSSRFSGTLTPRPGYVIRDGVPDVFLAPERRPCGGRVLYVGRIMRHKGIDVLIDALAPGTGLDVVGRVYDDEYHALLLERARGKDVRFVHDASDEVVAEHYRRALVDRAPVRPRRRVRRPLGPPGAARRRPAGEPRDRHAGDLHRRRRDARGRARRRERLRGAAQRPRGAGRPHRAARRRPGAAPPARGDRPRRRALVGRRRARDAREVPRLMHVCSIATPDHLARARVLARSLAEQHPEARLEVLVIGDIPAGEPFGDARARAARRARARGAARRLPPVRARLRAQAVAAAPRCWSAARPCSTSTPTRASTRRSTACWPRRDRTGSCSPATSAARCRATGAARRRRRSCSRARSTPASSPPGDTRTRERFLAWWAERLAEDCTVDTARGLFADQRWLDLAPGLVPGHAVADAGCNLAFWDLPNRPVTGGPGAYRAGDGPLRTFHFSGFDPERPEVAERAPGPRRPRRASPRSRACCATTRASCSPPATAAIAAPPEPAFGTPLMRRLYREGRASGALREPLSSPAGEAELVAWLREPAGPGAWAGLSRHLVALHAATPHLQAEFPDLDGADAVAYAEWARAHAGAHPELPAALAPPEATLPDGRPLDPLLLTLFARLAAPLPDFLAWLREPAPEGADAGVTRYLYELYLARPDLRAAFARPGAELVAWARTAGAHEHALLADYASSDRAGAGSFE